MAVISVKNLGVTLGGRAILNDITLPDIAPGQLLGLIGPNAAGKSTLLRAILGEARSSGTIEIDGRDIRAMNRLDRRAALSYMPQAIPQGSSLSPFELVRSFARATDLALPADRLEARIATFFSNLGLIAEAHRPMSVLSGGKRQLVGLCLTMLDEPTSALDLHWQLAAIGMVRGTLESGQHAAIIALHDINLALRFCDTIAVLKDGHLVGAGRPADIVSPDLIRDVYAVSARVERCSNGIPMLLADGPASHRQEGFRS